jgi:hypothetical protein
MKKCSYCGKEYPDEATSCAIDGGQLEALMPVETRSGRRDRVVSSRSEKHTDKIGPSGRWLIFGGIPVAVVAILLVSTLRHGFLGLEDSLGQNVTPYVVFFTPAVIGFGSMFLYDHFPKRLVIPCGIVGWIVGMSLIYWYFWFGPGAFNHD